MKKILYSIAALAVALGFTACSNEDEVLENGNNGKGFTVLAMTESGTRTELKSDGSGAYNVVWSEGDEISALKMRGTFSVTTLQLDSDPGKTTATFKSNAPLVDGTYNAFYNIEIPPSFILLWPSIQQYTGKISGIPMGGEFTVTSSKSAPITFINLGGLLWLNVKGSATISKIVISANQTMSGAFNSLAADGSAVIGTDTGVCPKSITLDCGTGVALNATNGTDFYIAMPTNTYTGVQITLTDTEGNTYTKTFKGAGLKIERSKITKASFKVFPFGQGEAAATNIGNVKWVQLWENGPKFAEYNVGVTDGKAESYGGYYCWGGTIDHDENELYWEGETLGDNDTATKLWGSKWRMPTKAEFEALLSSDNCDVEWTTVNNVNGLKFTGKGDYASNSVFLPAAGRGSGAGNVDRLGDYCYYWSSTPYDFDSDCAHILRFILSSDNLVVTFGDRWWGYSVRAVLAE